MCFESRSVSPVNQQSQAAAHSDSTVWKGFLSMLLCAHRELFPLTRCIEGRVGKKHAYRCPITTPCTLIHMGVQRARQTHTHTHFIQRLLVLNNDMRLPRMSMSLPVFVRSYFVLLWKPNVILKNPLSLSLSPWPPSCLSVEKNQSIRESQASSPTLAAAARLSAMIHGKDRVYANTMLVDQVSRAEMSDSFFAA